MTPFKIFLIALLAYFSPMITIFWVVLFIMLADLITGLYKSFKMKDPIISKKLRVSIEKFCFYMLAIIIAFVIGTEFLSFPYLGNIIAGFVVITESKSIFENIGIIVGNKLLMKDIWNKIIGIFKKKNDIE